MKRTFNPLSILFMIFCLLAPYPAFAATAWRGVMVSGGLTVQDTDALK